MTSICVRFFVARSSEQNWFNINPSFIKLEFTINSFLLQGNLLGYKVHKRKTEPALPPQTGPVLELVL